MAFDSEATTLNYQVEYQETSQMENDEKESEAALGRLTDKLYVSHRHVQDPLYSGPQQRSAWVAMDSLVDLIKDETGKPEVVLRETPTRQQLKAVFTEDLRTLQYLAFQRYSSSGKLLNREKFVLDESEIFTLMKFLLVLKSSKLILGIESRQRLDKEIVDRIAYHELLGTLGIELKDEKSGTPGSKPLEFSIPMLTALLRETRNVRDLAKSLIASDAGLTAAELAVIAKRRSKIEALRHLIESEDTTETMLQREMGTESWLFGGGYIGLAKRRDIAVLDQCDIVLLAPDGSLHVVELKGSYIPKLVKTHRNHLIPGPEVHEAVAQTMNYLRSLDEQGATLETVYRKELGLDYDLRRPFATVVIGTPDWVSGIEEVAVEQTLRSYNAHLSRIRVITYKALFDSAEKMLAFDEAAVEN